MSVLAFPVNLLWRDSGYACFARCAFVIAMAVVAFAIAQWTTAEACIQLAYAYTNTIHRTYF